jgi:hypothetical protein
MKLLMYLSSPAVVEIRFGDEIKFKRFCVETKLIKFGVETRFIKLAVETTPETEEIYPRVPNPIVVDVN